MNKKDRNPIKKIQNFPGFGVIVRLIKKFLAPKLNFKMKNNLWLVQRLTVL